MKHENKTTPEKRGKARKGKWVEKEDKRKGRERISKKRKE